MVAKRKPQEERSHFPRSSKLPDMTKCFVMMPIKQGFDEVYDHILRPLLLDLGVRAVRADEVFSSNPIIEDIWDQIQSAGWLVADLTGRNPNVFYELGLAHGIDRKVILLTQSLDDVPFDLRHWRCILYEQTIQGGEQLKDNLKRMFKEDPAYGRVPITLLTEGFKGGFRVLGTKTTVSLSRLNGAFAAFSEEWTLTPTGSDNMPGFVRKIQTRGVLSNVSCEKCEARIQKFMEGIFLLTIVPPSPVPPDQTVDYHLSYDIGNGFAPGEVFWNFDFVCPIDRFSYTFVFEKECLPKGFSAVRRSGHTEDAVDCRKIELARGVQYEASAQDVPHGDSIVFKWTWQ